MLDAVSILMSSRIAPLDGRATVKVGAVTESANAFRDSGVTVDPSVKLAGHLVSFAATGAELRSAATLLQVADAGLIRIDGKLDEMRSLAEFSATEPLSALDRAKLNEDFIGLRGELNKIAATTEFNGINPLAEPFTMTVDLGHGDGPLEISLGGATAADLSPGLATADIMTIENAEKAIKNIEEAKAKVGAMRVYIAEKLMLIEIAAIGVDFNGVLDSIDEFNIGSDPQAEYAQAISQKILLEAFSLSDDENGTEANTVDAPQNPDAEDNSSGPDEVASVTLERKLDVAKSKLDEVFEETAPPVTGASQIPLARRTTTASAEETEAVQTADSGIRTLTSKISAILNTSSAGADGDTKELVATKLQNLTALANLAGSGNNTATERAYIDTSFQMVQDEIEEILTGLTDDPSLGLSHTNVTTPQTARAALADIENAFDKLAGIA